MTDLENHCQCSWTIEETSFECAMCRIEDYLSLEYLEDSLQPADGEADFDGSLDD